MRRTIIIAILLILSALQLPAQKKTLDHDVYDSWQSVSSTSITDDGKYLTYSIVPQEGDRELVIVEIETGKELRVPRGGAASFTSDGKWAIFSIRAPFKETRAARIAKKKSDEMPKDSAAIVKLSNFELTKLPETSSISLPVDKKSIIAYNVTDSTDKSKKYKVFRDLNSDFVDTLRNVDKYEFNKSGDKLAVVYKKDKKDSLSRNEVVLYHFPSMTPTVLSQDQKYYSSPVFNEDGDKLAFLASLDSNSTGNKHCSVMLYEEIVKGKGKKAVKTGSVREIIAPDYTVDGKLCVTENSSLYFSKAATRLFLGISECQPEKDTTIIESETAKLDIWNWDIAMTPPIQKSRLSSLKSATYPAVINLSDPGRIIRLTPSTENRLSLINGADGELAMYTDDRAYQLDATWDSNSFTDVYLVNLNTGESKTVFTKLNGSPSLSPSGKYICWYSENEDELGWFTYRISDGRVVNVSEAAGVPFYDEEDDHPSVPPSTDRPHWYNNDEYFLMSDKYDIWRFDPDAEDAPVNLTLGWGRQYNMQFSYTDITKSNISMALSRVGVSKTINKKDNITFKVFDRNNKENGFATVNASKPGIINFFTDKFEYQSVSKARNADIITFKKGNFNQPCDQYTTTDFFVTEKKWSSINPRQAEYNWGNIQLVHWTAYDGTPLDGLLITPEDLDPNRKYPMMIYFYEKYSETLYQYRQPAPSASTVNLPFFASRGYVVFVPDIVYKDGHPGESAYNCICSGAEAMCEQFPFINKDKMGIQGQSWGGYQTAYLVTRTDMFAAAGAGAPVGNMTSAYGGIRWESGMVRAMQYEHGQSRIGKSLWDEGGLDLYIENSPIFHTQNVTTPTLIMHNDADGAVPWYQGIEFFMALRRFHHPAWLLQYNDEAHNLSQRKNRKDLSIRLSQFFDHYLKDEPMPAWMKTGVPMTRKGEYFGFEYVND